MQVPLPARSMRDAARRAIFSPSLWAIALILLVAEAGCHAQARSYPEGVEVGFQYDGSSVVADGEALEGGFEGSTLFVHNGTAVLADGIALVSGKRNASGAEAVGAVLGTWMAAIPAALLLLVIGAWLTPGYYRHQLGDDSPAWFSPGTELFRRVLAVRAMSAMGILIATIIGATPGIVMLAFAGQHGIAWLAAFGLLATFSGALTTWLYVQSGVLFADREVILGKTGPIAGLRRSWARARGRRYRRLFWAFGAWTIEAIGSLGWLAWFVGFLTHPVARAVSDTLMTRLYLEEAACA